VLRGLRHSLSSDSWSRLSRDGGLAQASERPRIRGDSALFGKSEFGLTFIGAYGDSRTIEMVLHFDH
jgi:hypothetical protein